MSLSASHGLRAVPPATPSFPALPCDGPAVDARACVEKGTRAALVSVWVVVALAAALIALQVFVLSAAESREGGTPAGAEYFGLVPVLAALVVWPLVGLYRAKYLRAILRGNAVQVGPHQLAPIHACVETFGRRLGLARMPEVFVVDEATVNAFAARLGRRDLVLLTDEAVDACLRGESPGALAFVIGHELGHVALGHNRFVRALLRRPWRALMRLDESSADRVAARLVGSREDAVRGLALLCGGPKLLPHLDPSALLAQAREVAGDKLTKAVERKLTHPLTLHRLARLAQEWESESARGNSSRAA